MSEHDHQKNLIRWARAQSGAVPALRYLFAVPNGGDRHRIVAAKLRAEGVSKGVPDLALPYPTDRHHGLFLEMKTEKGRLRPEQREWLERLADAGYGAAVAHGWEQGTNAITDYLRGRMPVGEVVTYKEGKIQ